jgi:sugar lactone lactonase YvrE
MSKIVLRRSMGIFCFAFSLSILACYNVPIPSINSATYSVTYDPNGSISGTPPIESAQFHAGDTVPVLRNTDLEEVWYSFAGWNTAADQTGYYYAAGSTFTMGTSNVTLYAQWGGTVTTLAGTGSFGSTDGVGINASFCAPNDVAVDSGGNVYVADLGNNLIRKITPSGVVTTLAGTGKIGSANGPGASASFNGPGCLAVDSSGNIYVSDSGNQLIRKITSDGVVSTMAGSGAQGASNGPGSEASFNGPDGLAVDVSGIVYVSDTYNNMIRKITPDGVVSTFAGTGTYGFTNGPGASATFNEPMGLAIDLTGNLYVADLYNQVIRKITPDGTVSTFAGGGGGGPGDGTAGGEGSGFKNGQGTAAAFWDPWAIAVDLSGNLYLADLMNEQIRKITASGVVTSIAGAWPTINGYYSPTEGSSNGVGPAATFDDPTGIAVDSTGNLYVAEWARIRKIQ